MDGNNRFLKATLEVNDLSRAWVADNLAVNNSTVDRWLQPKTRKGARNPTYRHMPNMAVALLKYRLTDNSVDKY